MISQKRISVNSQGLVFFAILALALHQSAATRQWTPAEVPRPDQEMAQCGVGGTASSFVCNPDNILSTQTVNELNALLSELRNTRAPEGEGAEAKFMLECGGQKRGFEFAVLAVDGIANSRLSNKRADAEEAQVLRCSLCSSSVAHCLCCLACAAVHQGCARQLGRRSQRLQQR